MIRFIQQRAERFVDLLFGQKPKARPRRVETGPRKMPSRWRWYYMGRAREVIAFAKTDARGKLKRLVGLKRLPVGACVEKLPL